MAGLWVPRPFVKPPSGARLNDAHPLVRDGGVFAFWLLNEGGGKAIDLVGGRPASPTNQAMWAKGGLVGATGQTVPLDSGASDTAFWFTDQLTIAYHGTLLASPGNLDSFPIAHKNNNWIFWSAGFSNTAPGFAPGSLALVWWDTGFVQLLTMQAVPTAGERHSAGISMTGNGTVAQGYYNGVAKTTGIHGWFGASRVHTDPVYLINESAFALDCIAFSLGYWTAEQHALWHADPYALVQPR